MEPRASIVFDPAEHSAMDRQFMLSQLVVPRPIAMVSTRSPHGVCNIAPMSYYLPITGSPMLVGVTMGLREDGGQKHTYENAMASGDFVINITSDALTSMIETVAMESPPEIDEYALAGWTVVESTRVSAPAIAEAPARLECVVRQVVELGEPGVPFGEVHLVIAEVVWVQYDEAIALGPSGHRQSGEVAPGRIDPLALAPVGRLGLRSFVRTVPDSVLELRRVSWEDHVAGTQGR